ncbi:MAG: hypothetical protein AAGA30_11045 [Planctomycetota bacterium]
MNYEKHIVLQLATFSIKTLLILTLICAAFFSGRASQRPKLLQAQMKNRQITGELDQALSDIEKFESYFQMSRTKMTIFSEVKRAFENNEIQMEWSSGIPAQ